MDENTQPNLHLHAIPTLTIFPDASEWIPTMGMTPAETRAMLATIARHPEVVRRAAEAGVLVLAGTDAGIGPHGMVRSEFGKSG